MNNKERVMCVVQGKKPDRTPTSFSCHFPQDVARGQAAVDAHLNFFNDSCVDILKVMNENQLRGNKVMQEANDFAQLALGKEGADGIERQVQLVSDLAQALNGKALLQVTIHGPMVSVHHMSSRQGFFLQNMDFYRKCITDDPKAFKMAVEMAATHLCTLVKKCLKAGADGIYFAALGAQKKFLTDEEYDELVKPYDLMVLDAAKDVKGFNVLHICGQGLAINRFKDYPVQAVNWEFGANNPGLQDAFKIFGKNCILLGGLDKHAGVLIDGTDEEIEKEVHDLLKNAQAKRLIVSAGCTLPTDISCARLCAVAKACKTFEQ